jgi:hypothetical protein
VAEGGVLDLDIAEVIRASSRVVLHRVAPRPGQRPTELGEFVIVSAGRPLAEPRAGQLRAALLTASSFLPAHIVATCPVVPEALVEFSRDSGETVAMVTSVSCGVAGFYRNRDWRTAVSTLYFDQRSVDLRALLEAGRAMPTSGLRSSDG